MNCRLSRFAFWLLIVLQITPCTPGAAVLRNDDYEIQVQDDGALSIKARGMKEPALFRAEFTVLHAPKPPALTSVKWQNPVYNLVGWKSDDGNVVQDVFKSGKVITLEARSLLVENRPLLEVLP